MGITKGDVVLSYDINKLHTDVKTAMKAIGYLENWKHYNNGLSYQLPNTTLWKPNTTSDQAIVDIKTVCSKLSVTLEKALAVKATEFVGV